jgi:hypothetical protein
LLSTLPLTTPLPGLLQVEYSEFLIGLGTLKAGGEQMLRLCFDIYDADGNGTIDRGELMKVLGGGTIKGDDGSTLCGTCGCGWVGAMRVHDVLCRESR